MRDMNCGIKFDCHTGRCTTQSSSICNYNLRVGEDDGEY
jgi:hypothetical protein